MTKRRRYFVSYSYANGFGATEVTLTGSFVVTDIQRLIAKEMTGVARNEVLIINFFELKSYEHLGGVNSYQSGVEG